MLLQPLNSLDAIPRRGRSTRSFNAFARRSNCVSKWKVRRGETYSVTHTVISMAEFMIGPTLKGTLRGPTIFPL
jgi:hypothetical protein